MSMLTMSHTSALERQLSIEETYTLAATARRKSSSQVARNDLRMKVGHAYMLEALEHAIRTSPPPSPKQMSMKPAPAAPVLSYSSLNSTSPASSPETEYDEYGFAYDDEEDDSSLSLCRTQSRR